VNLSLIFARQLGAKFHYGNKCVFVKIISAKRWKIPGYNPTKPVSAITSEVPAVYQCEEYADGNDVAMLEVARRSL
jgi:hypothetical protein